MFTKTAIFVVKFFDQNNLLTQKERLSVQVHPFYYRNVTLFLNFDFFKLHNFISKNVILGKNHIFLGQI